MRSIDLTSTSDIPPTVSIQVAGQPTYLALDAGAHRLYVESNEARETGIQRSVQRAVAAEAPRLL